MNINESKASTVLAAKTARPCDSCLIKRARWFCAADDAFLCQSCDAAVHSANQLASRHQRLRLETSSCKLMAPAWHQGFTKKARTPRQPKARQPDTHQLPLVPEMGSEDATFPEENDEDQLLFCRVPVFEPYEGSMVFDGDLNLDELLSGCDEELAEFAADVEGLIGTGVEEVLMDEKRVKGEEKEDIDDDEEEEEEVGAMIACHLDPALDMELSWEFNNSELGEKSMKKNDEKGMNNDESSSSQEKKRMLLRLNYEAVIAAWAAQGSPWADGIRPQLKQLEDEFMMMGAWLERDGIKGGRGDAGREARVSRYREKRRTRLFSKKIRYEVRKLNAEKRPRMKGRFVKRTTFLPSSNSSPNYHLIK